MSPVVISSRPQSSAGTEATRSRMCRPRRRSSLRVCGARHRLARVCDDAIAPAAHLVSESPEAGDPSAAHRTFEDHSTRCRVGVGAGPCVLDREPPLRHPHLEGGVIQVEPRPALATCLDRLVHPSVEAYEAVTTGAEWDPEQVDGGPGRLGVHPASLRRGDRRSTTASASCGWTTRFQQDTHRRVSGHPSPVTRHPTPDARRR